MDVKLKWTGTEATYGDYTILLAPKKRANHPGEFVTIEVKLNGETLRRVSLGQFWNEPWKAKAKAHVQKNLASLIAPPPKG